MPMFTDVAPFDDVNVRLALKYAIDREQLVKILLSGFGQVGNDSPITPVNRYFNTEKAVLHLFLERPAHRGSNVHDSLRGRFPLERCALEERALQHPAG